MNVLLIYLQPKDGLGHIRNQLIDIPCDKLILKYFPYPTVYKVASDTIKKHSEYSHILWIQNDIVFNKEHYFKLCESFQSTGENILGCSMNVDLTPEGKELCAFTVRPFEKTPAGYIPFVKKGVYEGKVKVYHNGGVFLCTREFFNQFPLKGFGKSGYNADIEQGSKIFKAGKNYLVDTSIHLEHQRYRGIMQVGIKEPEIEIIKY